MTYHDHHDHDHHNGTVSLNFEVRRRGLEMFEALSSVVHTYAFSVSSTDGYLHMLVVLLSLPML